jgi:hypothetical protein
MLPVESAFDPPGSLSGDRLLYDNCTPGWFTRSHTFTGVWFNTADFIPSGVPYQVGTAQIWFYHQSGFPCSYFISELDETCGVSLHRVKRTEIKRFYEE